MKRLGRIFTAMITPFDDRGEVNYDEAARIAEYLIANGNDGVVVGATTGESASLEPDEKIALFTAVKKRLGTRGTVIAGAGTNNTRQSVEFAKRTAQTGVDAVMAVVPYYSKPTQDGLLLHFGAIAQAVDVPVLLYNVPSRTVANMMPATTLELVRRHKNIVGIKESTGSVEQFCELITNNPRPAEFTVSCGDDYFYLPALALGAHGVVSVAGHICGPRLRAMVDAFERGDISAAGAIHREMQPLFSALFATTSPIPLKWALNELGFNAGPCRSPLGAMPDALAATMRELIAPYRSAVHATT
jgi:4-hydroxy-tetrahydrodipicolinate synthase